nr:unnamed protein product [Callosobruchus analis]
MKRLHAKISMMMQCTGISWKSHPQKIRIGRFLHIVSMIIPVLKSL